MGGLCSAGAVSRGLGNNHKYAVHLRRSLSLTTPAAPGEAGASNDGLHWSAKMKKVIATFIPRVPSITFKRS